MLNGRLRWYRRNIMCEKPTSRSRSRWCSIRSMQTVTLTFHLPIAIGASFPNVATNTRETYWEANGGKCLRPSIPSPSASLVSSSCCINLRRCCVLSCRLIFSCQLKLCQVACFGLSTFACASLLLIILFAAISVLYKEET